MKSACACVCACVCLCARARECVPWLVSEDDLLEVVPSFHHVGPGYSIQVIRPVLVLVSFVSCLNILDVCAHGGQRSASRVFLNCSHSPFICLVCLCTRMGMCARRGAHVEVTGQPSEPVLTIH